MEENLEGCEVGLRKRSGDHPHSKPVVHSQRSVQLDKEAETQI